MARDFTREFNESGPDKTYTESQVFGILKRLVNDTGSYLGTFEDLFEKDSVAMCLRQFEEQEVVGVEFRNGKFNLRIDDRGAEGGEFNLPVYIIDLGSMIGVVISCLVEGNEFARVLSKLNFYARFLRCLKCPPRAKETGHAIRTICGVFDGKDKPFWFGSSLATGSEEIEMINKTKDMYTRQRMLTEALRKCKPEIILPLMPPTHQRALGTHIKTLIYGKRVVDDEKVAKPIVRLLQFITQPREVVVQLPNTVLPPNSPVYPPWEIVSNKPADFKTKVDEIVAAAGLAPEKELEFEQIKEFVNGYTHWKQQYGHCAETYPLLFILRRSSTARDFQGLARSVSGAVVPVCAPFYAGEAMECQGSENCMMRCRGRGLKCTGDCVCPRKKTKKGIQTMCNRGEECTTVCRQSADCQTRCSGRPCATAGPFTPCAGRTARCEVCQKGKMACQKEQVDQCWRRVCQRCMDSKPCCNSCSSDGTCLKCDDFMAPCENCQALVSTDALGFENWNRSLNQPAVVNHYMIWDGWNTTRIEAPVAGPSTR